MTSKLLIGLLLVTSYAAISRALLDKEGVCTLNLFDDLTLSACYTDSECGSYMKCCLTTILGLFGRKVCKVPYFPQMPDYRYRQCPYQHEQMTGYRCGLDTHCSPGQFCCPNSDGYSVCKMGYGKK